MIVTELLFHLQGQTFLYQLLHKNEILEAGHCLQIKATTTKPSMCHPYYVRILNGGVHELEAAPSSTVRDCRYQLGMRGGPWGEDPCWLYGGTLMDSGYTLEHYGVRRKDTMDIVLSEHPQISCNSINAFTKNRNIKCFNSFPPYLSLCQ